MTTSPDHPYGILDFVPAGCCVLSEAADIVYWSPVLAAWTRRPPEAVLGRNLFEAFPDLAQPRFRDRILGVLQAGTPAFFSPALNPTFFPATRPGGHPRIQQTTLNRLPPDEQGRPRVLITLHDVTDPFERGEKYRGARMEALEEVKVRSESQARLQKVLENMPVMVFALDQEGRCAFWNRQAERITGYSAAELAEQEHLFSPLLPDERYRASVLRTLEAAQGHFLDWEVQFTCKNGSTRTLSLSSISRQVPIPGWPGGWGIGVDTTDRRFKEAALRDSEAKHRVIAELATSGILSGTAGGRIQDCNGAATALFQYTREELTRMTVADLVMEEFAGPMRLLGTPSLTMGNEILEIKCRRKGGSTFFAELSAKTYLVGGQRQFVVFVRDISEAKRAEEALRTAQKQESLGVLAGGIAHDFNNLFGAVMGNLELALERLPADSPARHHLDQIQAGIARASDLSRKMLAFSGKGRFSAQRLDPTVLLREMEPLLTAAIPRKVGLRLSIPEGIPPVLADGDQLQQVVVSLVNNAAEAIGDQEGFVDLVLSRLELDRETLRARFHGQALLPGPHVALAVQDTGCGISPENLARIFDPFYTTKFTGRGLSLSVVQGILKAHRAGCTVQSTPGKGTTITLYFPVAAAEEPVLPAPPRGASPVPRCVLLVDDEASLREATTELLGLLGFAVIAARDGVEAVETYRERQAEIGLVLMDLTMPRMDGRDAFVAIRRLDPAARIILSSGYSEHDVLEGLSSLDMAGFLPKPYRMKHLKAALEAALGEGS